MTDIKAINWFGIIYRQESSFPLHLHELHLVSIIQILLDVQYCASSAPYLSWGWQCSLSRKCTSALYDTSARYQETQSPRCINDYMKMSKVCNVPYYVLFHIPQKKPVLHYSFFQQHRVDCLFIYSGSEQGKPSPFFSVLHLANGE